LHFYFPEVSAIIFQNMVYETTSDPSGAAGYAGSSPALPTPAAKISHILKSKT
jgi:hypothetical protein